MTFESYAPWEGPERRAAERAGRQHTLEELAQRFAPQAQEALRELEYEPTALKYIGDALKDKAMRESGSLNQQSVLQDLAGRLKLCKKKIFEVIPKADETAFVLAIVRAYSDKSKTLH
jgi:hypothetical protein